MIDDDLLWLMNWYNHQCDGDWEHIFGIKIETLDNPGWSIQVSVQETDLQDKEFQDINLERTEDNWLFCKVRNGFFEGNCGIFNLPEVLKTFREWVESD